MNLYVIRHGEVDLNKEHLINGRNNSLLNERGINQAKEASNIIQSINIDLIICSPIKRTVQTCDILNKNNIQVVFDDRLMERDNKSFMYKSEFNLDKSIWYDEKLDVVYGDNEGFGSMIKRANEFLNDIKKYKYDNILIVTHGDVCRAINTVINNVHGYKNINELEQNNCEIKKYKL